MSKIERKKYFFLIAFLWIGIVSMLIFVREYTLRSGREVLLEIVPIDPRDLLRGRYVELRYKIGRLDLRKVFIDAPLEVGRAVYVGLKKGENGCNVAYGIFDRIPKDGDDVFIKGRIEDVYLTYVYIRYGIESYFLPEKEAPKVDMMINAGNEQIKVFAKVFVDKFGNAAIKSLILQGKDKVREI